MAPLPRLLGPSLCLLLASGRAAHAVLLENEHLQVDVAPDGLSLKVLDVSSKSSVDVASSWNVTLASQVLAPESCHLAGSTTGGPGAALTSWTCAAAGSQPSAHLPVYYTVDVEYALQPGHRFLTKALRVASSLPRSNIYGKFFIRQIAVWRSTTLTTAGGPASAVLVSKNPFYGDGALAAWARLPSSTVFMSVANPFAQMTGAVSGQAATVEGLYAPLMEHNASFAAASHAADVGVLGFTDRGQYQDAATGLYTHEAAAFRAAVDTFYLDGGSRRSKSVKVHVGWDESDYQIDVSTDAGWTQYRRIIDRCSELGIDHLVFGPHNDAHSARGNTSDGWGWEQVLWFSMGQRIRMGAFDPRTDAMPEDILQMVDYAKGRGVRLLAYVYPCLSMEPVAQYLIDGVLDLSVPEAHDWLLSTLVAFVKKSGAGGFAWDHDIFTRYEHLRYAQWRSWMSILAELRLFFPDLVMDHRQTAHAWGPWYHMAGSYAEPLAGDENPETYGVPLTSLHTDHIAADNLRAVNHIYSVQQLLPASRVPGFIFHQVERQDKNGTTPCEADHVCYDLHNRDFDYQGYKYSVISNIATAGLNNVFTMLPARDEAEFSLLPKEDVQFIRDWLVLVDSHLPAFARAAPIPTLAPAAWGQVDGWHAMDESDEGFLFLFNPSFGVRTVQLSVDEAIGLSNASNVSGWLVEELYPNAGNRRDPWKHGQKVQLVVQGSDALALRLTKGSRESLNHPVLHRGPKGRTVRVPWSARPEVELCAGLPLSTHIDVTFAGDHVEHGMPVSDAPVPPSFTGGWFNSSFSISQGVFDQLHGRQAKYPIQWTARDRNATWLDPSRLLMSIAYQQPKVTASPRALLDGLDFPVSWAFNSRDNEHAGDRCFTGYFLEATNLSPTVTHTLSLWMPPLREGEFTGLYWENLDTEYTEDIRACGNVPEGDAASLVIVI